MNSELFELCKKILDWWVGTGFNEHYGVKPMPEFVKEALEILGRGIERIEEDEE